MSRRKKGNKKQDAGGAENLTKHASKNAGAEAVDVLPINRKFAQRYEESRRRQFLSNAPSGLLENSHESSSSSEEEDDFGELLTRRIDRRVNETLEAIRNKDPRIYDKNTKFFEDVNDQSESGDSASGSEDDSEDEPVAGWDTIAKAAQNDTPKLTLKDYVRESLLQDGRLSDDDDDDDNDRLSDAKDEAHNENGDTVNQDNKNDRTGKVISKNSLHDLANTDDGGEGGDDISDDDDDLFTRKEKSTIELEEEERDFEVFMKKRAATTSKKAGEDLLLHSYLEKETPDEKERFLRDFVLNNGWLDKNAGEAPDAQDYEIEIDTSNVDEKARVHEDDDEFDEEVDNFEAQYNFRFEDPDGAQIVSHARHIPDSMRRPDNRRKRAREARRLRKEQEKAEKAEEMKRLKNLKKKEIQTRLLAIQEAAGDGVDLAGIDLEGDFDPDTFNKQMESKFNEEYYSMKDERMNDVRTEGMSHAIEKHLQREGRDDIPEDIREDVRRMADEYYDLDFEDIVGGVPMKFKYKKVEPESFSMTVEDILDTDDKELNRLVSLKYLAPYRPKRDVQQKAWTVRATLQKKKNGKSFHSGAEDRVKNMNQSGLTEVPFDADAETGDASVSGSRKRKRRKSKSDPDNQDLQNDEPATVNAANIKMEEEKDNLKPIGRTSEKPENDRTEIQDEKSSKRRKRRNRARQSRKSFDSTQMPESRLKAYGISPP